MRRGILCFYTKGLIQMIKLYYFRVIKSMLNVYLVSHVSLRRQDYYLCWGRIPI